MMGEEKDNGAGRSWKTFSRSVSLIECSPNKSTSKPLWNSKARACLPPLQPLSIVRPNIEEWPRAGSDDLGVWPHPSTPGAGRGSVKSFEDSTLDHPAKEFEFLKDKVAFFDKECSRISNHIYVGSDAVAKNREILRHNGITHVLNCVGSVCSEYFRNELVYRTLWLQDCPSEDIASILYDVFDYFEDVQEQGGRVLVHCCHGVSRSTSLVIAYLIWKDGQSFDDAFKHVKAVRGVTNPNVGFACQLLQCEKRVHALPASPTSVIRMYRMAPHSAYDPLHLVPKLCEPGADKLDSRGGFIINCPSALYVWTGKICSPLMSDYAKAAAFQVIRYEKTQGPVITVKEGEEPLEFWNALYSGKKLTDCLVAKSNEGKNLLVKEACIIPSSTYPHTGQRKFTDTENDLDFKLFYGALSSGVIPAFPSSETEAETCLPVRENGWNKLKRKFDDVTVKEMIPSSNLNWGAQKTCVETDMIDTSETVFKSSSSVCKESFTSEADLSMSSRSQSVSPHSSTSYTTGRTDWTENNLIEVEYQASISDISLFHSPPLNLLDSLSRLMSKQDSSSTSPSLSPSNSDCSSSLSPSLSNCSDMSFSSAQPLLYGCDAIHSGTSKSSSEEIVGVLEVSSQSHLTVDLTLH